MCLPLACLASGSLDGQARLDARSVGSYSSSSASVLLCLGCSPFGVMKSSDGVEDNTGEKQRLAERTDKIVV